MNERMFSIGGNDYTNNLVVPNYKINSVPVYNEWQDGNGNYHRDVIRERISGTFVIKFSEQQEYFDFVEVLKTYKNEAGGYTPVSLYVMNQNEFKNANVFISMTPENDLPFYGVKSYDGYEVTIEEK